MAFLSLYRKYRPHTFDDLVGQKNVIKTLKNALEYDRIAHAYLFAGPRGTGKTSTAKIYARALNCVEGPTANPCGSCEPCKKIQSGNSIDVIEIDAASNRGIDEIRDLREKVKFYPGEGRYKVYIIDEVHMLTPGAFNALLKTLEEPPANVVFILATTEPHKVIDTILSRCQRFDFSLLSVEDIKERLLYICRNEDVTHEEKALDILAGAAKGGLRDAISLLDQAISYTNSNLTGDEVRQMLGKVDINVLNSLFKAVVNGNTAEGLKIVNEIIDRGKGISIFIADMINFLRQVMLYKECGNSSNIFNFNEEMMQYVSEAADLVSLDRLIEYLEILAETERKLSYADRPRIILELGLVKMVTGEADNSPDSLNTFNTKLAELEDRLGMLEKGRPGGSRAAQEISAEGNTNSPELRKDSDRKSEKDSEQRITYDNREENADRDQKRDNEGSSFNIEDIREAWPLILKRVKKKDISIHALLIEGKPAKIEGDKIIIDYPPGKNFHKKGAERQSELIRKVISKVLKQNCRLEFRLDGRENSKKKDKNVNDRKKEKDIKDDDIVNRVARAFNGQVIKVNHQILENE